MTADCKRGVNNRSSDLLTRELNALFTVVAVGKKNEKKPEPIAQFALGLAEERFGSVARFSVELFGSDKRQQVGQWLYRGIPHNQRVNVAQKLGMTVEQLLAAGNQPIPEAPLPAEAVAFAREWTRLPGHIRAVIQALVLSIPKDLGRIEGEPIERPILQRSKRA
jgi:hypothetical protein